MKLHHRSLFFTKRLFDKIYQIDLHEYKSQTDNLNPHVLVLIIYYTLCIVNNFFIKLVIFRKNLLIIYNL